MDRPFYGLEAAAAFGAASIVWLGYKHHYGASANIVKAGSMRLPIVACESGLIGWQTQKYRLGVTVDPGKVDSVISAVCRIASNPEFAESCGQNGHRTFSQRSSDVAVDAIAASLG